jgi:peptide/nickel transport system substrate-binding protein
VTIGMPSILTEPWNPVAGTNWIFDQMIIRATGDSVVLPDPFIGLPWPRRIKSAQVFVEEGLPVTKSQDWVELSFVPTIQVPQDAWIDWDPGQQRFITVGEAHPGGLTSRTKSVVRYSDDLFQQRWHDGTTMSLADLLMGLILTFDRAKEQSALYDEAEVPAFETFARTFRGARIVQENPLVVEVYSDQILPDAELMSRAGYFYATEPWHTVAVGVMAEANHELAFSKSKADRLRVEWASYIAGPSLSVLERYANQGQEQATIPFQNTLGKYATPDQARERYTALNAWYRERRHFWVGQGPYYLNSVHPVEKIVVLRRAEQYREVDERWIAFTKPRIAEVEISGPSRVATEAAEFRVNVTFEGKPYPRSDMDSVRFLLFDPEGKMALVEDAQGVRDGEWKVALSAEQTARLAAGPHRLEVVAVPRVVSVPSFQSFRFVKR